MGHAKWAKGEPCTDITTGGVITEASRGPDASKHHTQVFLSNSHNSSMRGFPILQTRKVKVRAK